MSDSNIGMIIEDFEVIECIGKNSNRKSVYKIKCLICGKIRTGTLYDLKRCKSNKHNYYNCTESFRDEEVDKIYGDLKIISFIKTQSNNKLYKARCQICGREKDVWIKHVKNKIGVTHSNCVLLLPKNKHTTRLRSIWSKIIYRCENEKCDKFSHYGGRGITHNYPLFIDFYDDMYKSYMEHLNLYGEKNTTIERMDVDGNYCKENLKWATLEEQALNKRKTKTFIAISPNGVEFKSKGISKFCRENELNRSCVWDCLNKKQKSHRGWIFEYID